MLRGFCAIRTFKTMSQASFAKAIQKPDVYVIDIRCKSEADYDKIEHKNYINLPLCNEQNELLTAPIRTFVPTSRASLRHQNALHSRTLKKNPSQTEMLIRKLGLLTYRGWF